MARKNNGVAALAVVVASALTLVTMGSATSGLVIALLLSYGLWIARSAWPVPERVVPVYVAALIVQCAHLVEEYRGGFHRLFPLVFDADPWSGRQFLAFNLVWLSVFVVAGFGLIRNKRLAYLAALFLALGGGIANGLGHLALAARAGGYFPGAYTGVLALLVGIALTFRLLGKPVSV